MSAHVTETGPRPDGASILAQLTEELGGTNEVPTPQEARPARPRAENGRFAPRQQAEPEPQYASQPEYTQPATPEAVQPPTPAPMEVDPRDMTIAELNRQLQTMRGQVSNAAMQAAQQAAEQARREERERWAADETTRIEAQRARILADIQQGDPDARQAVLAYWQAQWTAEDAQRLQKDREALQAERQSWQQQQQQLAQQASFMQVQQALPQLLPQYAREQAAGRVAQLLGRPVDPNQVAAIFAEPENVQRAQYYLSRGKDAFDVFGEEMARLAATRISSGQQERRADIEANRLLAVADGTHGQPQRVPQAASDEDLSQYAAGEGRRRGDMMGMLRGLSRQQGFAGYEE